MIYYFNQTYSDYVESKTVALSYQVIIQLALQPIGIVTSVINTLIFSKQDILIRSHLFRFVQVMSIVDLIYLSELMLSTIFWVLCGSSSTKCGSQSQYAALIIYWITFDYASSALAVTNIIIEMILTIHRLCLIKSSTFVSKSWQIKLILPLILIAAHVYYLPVFALTRIDSYQVVVANSTIQITEYHTVKSDFSKTRFGLSIPIVLSLVRFVVCGPVLLVLNSITACALRSFIKKKEKLTAATSSEDATKRSEQLKNTLMLLSSSFLYIFGNMPFMMVYPLALLFENTMNISVAYIIGVSCLIVAIILKPVVYFSLNSVYRNKLVAMFRVDKLSRRVNKYLVR